MSGRSRAFASLACAHSFSTRPCSWQACSRSRISPRTSSRGPARGLGRPLRSLAAQPRDRRFGHRIRTDHSGRQRGRAQRAGAVGRLGALAARRGERRGAARDGVLRSRGGERRHEARLPPAAPGTRLPEARHVFVPRAVTQPRLPLPSAPLRSWSGRRRGPRSAESRSLRPPCASSRLSGSAASTWASITCRTSSAASLSERPGCHSVCSRTRSSAIATCARCSVVDR